MLYAVTVSAEQDALLYLGADTLFAVSGNAQCRYAFVLVPQMVKVEDTLVIVSAARAVSLEAIDKLSISPL